MQWERLIYTKYRRWGYLPRISVTKRGQVTWNVQTNALLKNPKRVYLMITPDGTLLGIKAAPAKDAEAFPVQVNKAGTAWHIRAKGQLTLRGILPEETKAYQPNFEDDVAIVILKATEDESE